MRALLLALGLGLFLLPAAERITLTGSSTVAPLAAEIARRFEAAHPDVRIDVQTGGSSRGIADVRAGRADIGMASRAVRPGEEDLIAHTIAIDGVAVIVHRDQTVRDLSREQVIGIFTGAITAWPMVGGSGDVPLVINKAEGRATLEVFCDYFGLKPAHIQARSVVGDNAHGIKTVAAHRDTIGYVSIGPAETAVADGVAIRMLGLDGITPSTETLRNGVWPVSRPLNLIITTTTTPSPTVAAFLAFARSPAVDDLIADLGYVPPPR